MKLEMFYRKTTFWSQPSLSPVLIVHMEETLSRQKMFCAKPALPQCSVQSPRYPVETPSNLGDGFLDMTEIKLIIMPRHKLWEPP
jgi:hypothetical protein